MIKLIIAGSRDFKNYELLKENVDEFLDGQTAVVISGTASGADSLGIKYAKEKEFEVIEKPAYWQNLKGAAPFHIGVNKHGMKYNKLAGHIRNEEMAKIATHCILFWNGKVKALKTC